MTEPNPTPPPAPAGTKESSVDVCTPFAGMVTLLVAPGESVASGDVLAVLEAMKMEAPVTAPRAGVITAANPRLLADEASHLSGGDLIVTLT